MPNSSVAALEFFERLRTVLIYRWRMVLVVAAALVAIFLVVVRTIPDTFEGTTTILAYPRKVPEKYVSTTVVDEPGERLNLLQQEILSATRLQEIISNYGLYSRLIEREGRDAAVVAMRRHIKIQTSKGGGSGPSAFTLTFSGDDPRQVAAVTNELANSFILKNLSNRQQQVRGTTDFLNDELEGARSSLESQEAQLRAYRMSHLGQMPEQITSNLQAIGQLQVQYQVISDKLAQLEEQKFLLENGTESGSAHSADANSPETSVRNDIRQEETVLASLLSHDTPAHPDVAASQSRLAELRRQLDQLPARHDSVKRLSTSHIEVIEKQRTRLLAEQDATRARLNAYQVKVDAVPLRQEQLSRLTRDYETARDHYRSLLEKHYSAQMASELESRQDADRFEVLDPATPADHATTPNRPLLWAMSTGFALLGGMVIAFSREQVDNTIKSEADLLRLIPADLEFLGSVSRIKPVALPKKAGLLSIG